MVWWEIECPNPEAFQEFHAALWGWSFEPAFGDTTLGADYWIIREGDRGVGGLQRSYADRRPQAGTRLYWQVDDLEGVLNRARALGAVVERGRTALGGDDRWFATVLDPAGVSVGLWTDREASPSH